MIFFLRQNNKQFQGYSSLLTSNKHLILYHVFVVVFLGCTSTGRVGLCFLWFYVRELPKAQPAVVLVLKRLRRRDNGLKKIVNEYDQEIPQSQTADNRVAP